MIPEKELQWDTFYNGNRWQRIEALHLPTGLTTTIYRDELSFPRTHKKAQYEALIKLEAKVRVWKIEGSGNA